jgi:hypothetical protein
MKMLESFLSKNLHGRLVRFTNDIFYIQKFLYENFIKQTPDPAEKGIPMARSSILGCHHLGQLPPLLISAMIFTSQWQPK